MNTMKAAIATGIASGPEVIREWQGEGTVIIPNPEIAATYAPLHAIYSDLYQASKEQMHQLHELGY